MRTLILVLLLLGFLPSHAGEIFKWKDEKGNIHFGDEPPADAQVEKIDLAPVLTPPPENRARGAGNNDVIDNEDIDAPDKAKKADGINYSVIAITSPEPNETIHANDGMVSVSTRVSPALNSKENHQIQFLLDGTPTSSGVTGNTTFHNLDRGEHTVQAAVVDEKGMVLLQSEPVIFFVRRFSKLHPRPNN